MAGGGRVAADLGDLERADDPARVARVDARRGRGRERAQALDERREAVGDEVGFERGADGRIARQRVGVEAARDGPEVEAGAAGEDRHAVLGRDRGQRRAGVASRSRRR